MTVYKVSAEIMSILVDRAEYCVSLRAVIIISEKMWLPELVRVSDGGKEVYARCEVRFANSLCFGMGGCKLGLLALASLGFLYGICCLRNDSFVFSLMVCALAEFSSR